MTPNVFRGRFFVYWGRVGGVIIFVGLVDLAIAALLMVWPWALGVDGDWFAIARLLVACGLSVVFVGACLALYGWFRSWD